MQDNWGICTQPTVTSSHFSILIKKLTMIPKLSLFVFVWAASLALGQQALECTREVARSDECADVINPNACYNQFRWNSRTLSCIDGKDDADRKRKVKQDRRDLAMAWTQTDELIFFRPASAATALEV
ncbi:hypothetical protein QBC44DRAFT_314000 [Cladorrhinum sp. PSN332]|nr:hypothetical protein QBC44DRAFT_314000 [Cladorrhinum sp. PSN332]